MLTGALSCWSHRDGQLDGIPIEKCPGAALTARDVARKGRGMPAAEWEFLRMATAVGPAYRRSKQGEFNHSGGNG